MQSRRSTIPTTSPEHLDFQQSEPRPDDSGDNKIHIPQETEDEPKQRRRDQPSRFRNNALDDVYFEDEIEVEAEPKKTQRRRRGRPKILKPAKNKVPKKRPKKKAKVKDAIGEDLDVMLATPKTETENENEEKDEIAQEITARQDQSGKHKTQDEVPKKKWKRKAKVKDSSNDNYVPPPKKGKSKKDKTKDEVPKKRRKKKTEVKDAIDVDLDAKSATPKIETENENEEKDAPPARKDKSRRDKTQDEIPKKRRKKKIKTKSNTINDMNSKSSKPKTEAENEEKDEPTARKEKTQDEVQKKGLKKNAEVNNATGDDMNSKLSKASFESLDVDEYAELPTIQEIHKRENGLAGIIREDQLCSWNLRHGSNSAILLKVLQSLCWGQLPDVVKKETPLLRPYNEVSAISETGGPPPRFYGLVRYAHSVKKFAIECPQLLVFRKECHTLSLPPSLKCRGEVVLLRVNMDEFTAGQLYVFVLRLLYGKNEVDRLHKQCQTSISYIQEVIASFGETGKTDDQKNLL